MRGWLARLRRRFDQWACGLHGHDPVLRFDGGRMYLWCATCHFETPGWETGGEHYEQRFTGRVAPRIRTEVVVRTKRLRRGKAHVLPMRAKGVA